MLVYGDIPVGNSKSNVYIDGYTVVITYTPFQEAVIYYEGWVAVGKSKCIGNLSIILSPAL